MAVGVVVGIISVVAIVRPLVGTFTSREYLVPNHLSLHLSRARYTVYERSGSRSGLTVHAGAVTIDPSQVVVTGPSGEPVYVFQDGDTETIQRGSVVYTGAVQFDAPASGTYDVQLSTRVTTVVIARSLFDAIHSVLGWFGAGAIGAIVFILGLVLLIVGATRRGRTRRALQPGWGQPPYWGQPPPYGAPPQYGAPPPGPPDDPWAAPPG
jgi:hypothetical protein